MYCSKCGNEISENEKFCPNCGNKIENQLSNTTINTENKQVNNNVDESTYIIGLISLISSIVGLFAFGIICGLIGIICGIIVREKSPKEENELSKAVWNYNNKSRGFATAGLILGIIDIFLVWIYLMTVRI